MSTTIAEGQLEAFRKQKDKFLAEHPQSPILPEDKEHFRGANYFPVNMKYRVLANLVPETRPGSSRCKPPQAISKNTRGLGASSSRLMTRSLSLGGFMPPADEPLHGSRLFVPFRDKTSGKETYGAGRYLDLNKRPATNTCSISIGLTTPIAHTAHITLARCRPVKITCPSKSRQERCRFTSKTARCSGLSRICDELRIILRKTKTIPVYAILITRKSQ